MKTGLFRLWVVGASIGSLAFLTGCKQKVAEGEVPPIATVATPYVGATPNSPDISGLAVEAVPVSLESETKVVQTPPAGAPITSAVEKVEFVQGAVTPANVPLSAPLQEIVRMHQSGVNEEVILSYVTNSASSFALNSDQIIYLHDLGFSSAVTKALIQHDSAAEALARQESATRPKTTTPGTTYYPGGTVVTTTTATTALPPAYEETQPVTTPAPAVTTTTATAQPQTPVSVNYFYNHLSPYGNWVQVEGYGLCWQPSVAIRNPEWRPYSDEGYWLWSDNGWYWYSYYSWGWAPFHYGRWSHRPHVGWFWAPDTHWGPAWVSWRESGDYCGWAPLPPEVVFVPGMGLHYHGAAFAIGFDFGLADFHYTFISRNHFCERRPHHFFLPRHRREPLFRQSLVVNHYALDRHRHIVNHGVGFDRINAAAPGRVQRATFRETPLGAPAGPRPERMEVRAGGVVVHRPVLPKDSAAKPEDCARYFEWAPCYSASWQIRAGTATSYVTARWSASDTAVGDTAAGSLGPFAKHRADSATNRGGCACAERCAASDARRHASFSVSSHATACNSACASESFGTDGEPPFRNSVGTARACG